MNLDVVLLPTHLVSNQLAGRAVVVFDVLRATTTLTAALEAGADAIYVFADLQSAAQAAQAFRADGMSDPRRADCILCGESNCLPPPGFDLGNSPAAFTREAHAGRVAFMSTTNGTRAIVAAREATHLFAGALINAGAVARRLGEVGRDVTFLCAGTGGQIALEDVLGAGAVIDAIGAGAGGPSPVLADSAQMAARLFRGAREQLRETLAAATGGRNVIAAGLAGDIDFAARVSVSEVVGQVLPDPLRVVRV